MDLANQITGSISETGRKTLEAIQREGSALLEPTCETLRPMIRYSWWALGLVTILLVMAIFMDLSKPWLVFLILTNLLISIYAIYIDTKWPNMNNCVSSGTFKQL